MTTDFTQAEQINGCSSSAIHSWLLQERKPNALLSSARLRTIASDEVVQLIPQSECSCKEE
jgi:hypothetical protein